MRSYVSDHNRTREIWKRRCIWLIKFVFIYVLLVNFNFIGKRRIKIIEDFSWINHILGFPGHFMSRNSVLLECNRNRLHSKYWLLRLQCFLQCNNVILLLRWEIFLLFGSSGSGNRSKWTAFGRSLRSQNSWADLLLIII